MKTINIKNLSDIETIEEPLCAAIGNFDGVHLGHQILINQSKIYGLKSAVLTFYPHPSVVLKNIPNYPLLTPMAHKIKILEDLFIDYLIIIDFTSDFAKVSKEDFMALMHKLNIRSVVCGYDFSFGYMGLGNVRDLEKEFDVHEVSKYVYNGIRVSSTYIRELLDSGNVIEASKLLGRNYSISGPVVAGNELGRTIGFPTANIRYDKYYLPKNGVYYVKVIYEGIIYDGMCNVGNNPTFNFTENKRLEVNIFDFDKDIYMQNLEILFYARIRGEHKYASKEELISQLEKDKLTIKNIIENA